MKKYLLTFMGLGTFTLQYPAVPCIASTHIARAIHCASRGMFKATQPHLMSYKEAQKILGAEEKDSPQELKSKYHKAIMKAHPDHHGGTNEKAQDVTSAYDILGGKERATPSQNTYSDPSQNSYEEEEYQQGRQEYNIALGLCTYFGSILGVCALLHRYEHIWLHYNYPDGELFDIFMGKSRDWVTIADFQTRKNFIGLENSEIWTYLLYKTDCRIQPETHKLSYINRQDYKKIIQVVVEPRF